MSASTGTTHTDDPTGNERSRGAGAPRVSEREAREVAEKARESGWSRPSFAKAVSYTHLTLPTICSV